MVRSLRKLKIALISVHGLVRGSDLELGRDADTGGQTLYVVELARALARHPRVARVDLITRRIVDPTVDASYAAAEESLGPRARILRVEAGPTGYLPKEELWDHLPAFADSTLERLSRRADRPHVVHAHYADAGFVGARVASVLGAPLLFTGHSLGRVKRRRLLAAGMGIEEIEERYRMARRVEAEEEVLAVADRIIASTQQEVKEQYELYDHYATAKMEVVPPGVDVSRFLGEIPAAHLARVDGELRRFLREPDRPCILALARPDGRKNLATLVEAYGSDPALRRAANLVIVAGTRQDLRELQNGARQVISDLLTLMDVHDLYGVLALPKNHVAEEVPAFYRWAADRRGVFVNPALTEPFGLTLLEAAASGLPLVATEDGGPQEILANCRSGLLVDPLDPNAIASAIGTLLGNRRGWQAASRRGRECVMKRYSWEAHATRYVELVQPLLDVVPAPPRIPVHARHLPDRAVFTDLDQSLLGDPGAIEAFLGALREHRSYVFFGIATGRRLDSALRRLREVRIPEPDVLITSLGTEITYGPPLQADTGWRRHIDHLWNCPAVREALDGLPGLVLQPGQEQSPFKISYYYDAAKAPSLEEVQRILHREELAANVWLSFGQYLDLVPVRASKGFAMRHFATRFGIPLSRILVAGGTGADADLLRGNVLGVVVANRHQEELSALQDQARIYFAQQPFASGLVEAIAHYDFFGACEEATT